MSVHVTCGCGRELEARDEFAGASAECPYCGNEVAIPERRERVEVDPEMQNKVADFVASVQSDRLRANTDGTAHQQVGEAAEPEGVSAPGPAAPPDSILRRMLDAVLDPRAIRWLLMLGGALFVLGLIVWLISIKVFDDPRTVAFAMGLGSAGVLVSGWVTTLRTAHKTAGHAVTFLGCVVMPLNLWFYHAQGLITLEGNLWLGGLVCVVFYTATVYLLRSPLFMYAVEAGLTLTTLLLMADLGQMRDAADFCFWLLGLAFLSIVAERGFANRGEFDRRRYGLPLFRTGHVQLAASLSILLVSQSADWLRGPLGLSWPGNRLTDSALLAGGLWCVGAFLYVYSDIAVRRLKGSSRLAAVCVLMAFATGVLPYLPQESLIALVATVALTAHAAGRTIGSRNPQLQKTATSASVVLSLVPVLMGLTLHLRATSRFMHAAEFGYNTGWWFVAAMLVVAVTNRISAALSRRDDAGVSTSYFMFSAAGAIIAAAGLLRQLGWTDWFVQAPLLMMIPIAYLAAGRLYRGGYAERPLQWVAQAATFVILSSLIGAALESDPASLLVSVQGSIRNQLLGIALFEGCVFFVLAGLWQHRGRNVFGATVTGCAALWHLLGYFGVAAEWYQPTYTLSGVCLLLISRMLGVVLVRISRSQGELSGRLEGRGATIFHAGHAILTVSLVASFLKGLVQLGTLPDWTNLVALVLTAILSAAAILLAPSRSGWRQWYMTSTVALAGVAGLSLSLLMDLSGWQKFEIVLVACGMVLLVISCLGRFRESPSKTDPGVTLGLGLGSALSVGPLFVATCWYRWNADPSFGDEIALLTMSLLMLALGLIGQMKSPTLLGGLALVLYLMILVGSVVHRPQVAIGIYLMGAASVIFAAGIVASVYRDRLLEIPGRVSRREGVFRIIGWR